MSQLNKEQSRHIPVMLDEVLASLMPIEDALIVDCTFGAGGYSRALMEAGARVIALDRDPDAIAAGQVLARQYGEKLQLVHAPFSQLSATVHEPVDAIVFDIGVSSMQIDEGSRGFSFQREGPLDMRMSHEGISAADIVNQYEVEDLVRIFRQYGEERHSSRIARMIAKKREQKPFTRTLELAQAIEALIPRHYGVHAIHPATRVFQALRIAVNDELGELTAGLNAAEELLKPDGRLVVVSFHSLEDRIVKSFFADRCRQAAPSRYLPLPQQPKPSFTLLFKGAKTASEAEKAKNPRARSAKLRAGLRTDAPPVQNIKMIPVRGFAP